MTEDKILRERLVYVLQGKGAHITFDKVLPDFPKPLQGKKLDGAPYSPWQLLEHIRIAQWDILEFSRNPDHVSPDWPEGYWPEEEAPPNQNAWEKSVEKINKDLKEMQQLVTNPETDLYARLPHGTGQNILREALLVADHNAYHLGQLVLLKKIYDAKTQ
jgi:hypothetical protein